MLHELRTQYPKNAGHTAHCRVWLLTRGHVAFWELRLTASAQHRKRVSYCTSQAREKTKIQSMISTEYVSLLHHHEIKTSQIEPSSGTVCIYVYLCICVHVYIYIDTYTCHDFPNACNVPGLALSKLNLSYSLTLLMTWCCMYYDHSSFLAGEAVTLFKNLPEVTQLLRDRGSHRQAWAVGQSYLGGQRGQERLHRPGNFGLESISRT